MRRGQRASSTTPASPRRRWISPSRLLYTTETCTETLDFDRFMPPAHVDSSTASLRVPAVQSNESHSSFHSHRPPGGRSKFELLFIIVFPAISRGSTYECRLTDPIAPPQSLSFELMLQRFVDDVLAVAKESVKTLTYESVNNIVRFINGVSAVLLTLLPGKTSILEGIHGWELRPTFRGPRFPRWMEDGVSSFNQFIHDFSMDSGSSSSDEYLSGEEDNDENICPPSPMSHCSRFSRSSTLSKYDKRQRHWTRRFLSWIFWPITFPLKILLSFFRSPRTSKYEAMHSSSGNQLSSSLNSAKKSNFIKDHVVHRTTDRRRGVVEDLQLGIEIFIEAVFDIFHQGAYYLLSPWQSCKSFYRWLFTHDSQESPEHVSVPTTSLGDVDPTPRERVAPSRHSLNTDGRTCQDVITELGYPYEAIHVITSDGYVLLLERIPRRDSQKAVYLQHGIMDSSMGWVSNGVVGSPAFAAYDQGYDVFLGNLRGLVSREHVDKNISSRRYWRYSINEHGTQDVPAMIEKIHEIKTAELAIIQADNDDEINDQPYKLCSICHSLGGAVMLMYVIMRRMEQKPHRLSRLIMLSPAGFHEDSTVIFTLAQNIVLLLAPILAPLVPGLYIPTRFFRMLLNKLARDFHNYPALGGLVQTLMSYVVGGDSSNWVGVIGLPHYNMNDMPGVSFYVVHHFAQIKRAKKFLMYDYGSDAANMEAYGSPEPVDLGLQYGLIDIPVDLVAGRKDKVIPPSMIRKHYKLLKNAGVEASYRDFEYAHLDFTFSHREELLSYVMSRLLLVVPPAKKDTKAVKGMKLKKTEGEKNSE
ncbi:hypothetical protein H6P81_009521 [Aristolochia fimbriata]|uniref:Partial AB-hydrolase lipase domain-containing protein n=1 Tax=Aristolochia fimbriata TaxID=158543 RepID=A0AAV7EM90_ARIFI|nr:hypothetical protein H6P81_009521 [Aristolochia fimbriata]